MRIKMIFLDKRFFSPIPFFSFDPRARNKSLHHVVVFIISDIFITSITSFISLSLFFFFYFLSDS